MEMIFLIVKAFILGINGSKMTAYLKNKKLEFLSCRYRVWWKELSVYNLFYVIQLIRICDLFTDSIYSLLVCI